MKGKELLFIVISSFLLTVIWIASNVYHAYATSTIDSLLQVQILPISPDFDQATISKLKQRQPVTPLSSVARAQSPTPTISAPLQETNIEPTGVLLPSETPVPTSGVVKAAETITPTP